MRGWFGRRATTGMRDRSGTAAIEFAIVGPVLILMLMGLMAYGGYFWMSHMVQQLTNDAARSAVAGLTAAERSQLAATTVSLEAPNYAFLDANRAAVSVNSDTQSVTIAVAYDASNTPFWALHKLLPMPSSTIRRTATIKLGGY